MFQTRASRRRGLVYGILLAAGLFLLALSSTPPMRDAQTAFNALLAPAEGALSGMTRDVGSIFSALAEVNQLRTDNKALQERNQELEVENRRLQEIRIQNDQLSRLLGVQGSLDYKTVAATVVSREISQYVRVITIDEGTDRGIQLGDVVVAGGAALVGQVWQVGPNFSRILLISDTRSTVIGLIESSRATGDVNGQLGGALVMENIPATERLNLDDTVVTAGIDLGNDVRSTFPKGLLIGNVVDVQRDPNAVVQTAFIDPAADLDKLEYVLVITDYHGGLPLPVASGSPAAGASAAPGSSVQSLPLPSPSFVPGP